MLIPSAADATFKRGLERIADEGDRRREVREDVLVFGVLHRDAAVPWVLHAWRAAVVAALRVHRVVRAHGQDVRDAQLRVVVQRQRRRQAANNIGG